MSYVVELKQDALDDLARLPLPLQHWIEQEISRLAREPVKLSRPASFPYPPGQAYRLETVFDGTRYFVTVLFRYSQDETTLEVFGIPAQTIGPSV